MGRCQPPSAAGPAGGCTPACRACASTTRVRTSRPATVALPLERADPPPSSSGDRDGAEDAGAVARRGVDRQLSADRLHAVAHVAQPPVAVYAGSEPRPVVADLDGQEPVLGDRDPHA